VCVVSANDSENNHLQLSLVEGLAGSLGASVAIFDRDDTLVYSSRNFSRFFEVSEEVLKVGIRLRDFLGAVYDSGARFGGATRNGASISRGDWIAERIAIHWRERYEEVEQLPDGRWVKLGKRRMPGGLLICHISDVTDQKRREEDLDEAGARARLAKHVFDSLPNPVLVKDEALSIVLINKAFCRLLGVEEHEIVGRRAADLVGAEAARIFEERERQVLSSGEPIEFVEDIPHPDESLIRSITRQHRLTLGSRRYVTVSIDRVTTQSHVNNMRRRACARTETSGTAGVPMKRRVLVVDQDMGRARTRAGVLVAENVEAMAIDDLRQLFAFLDTARTMDVTIDAIEITPELSSALASNPAATEYPVLARLLAERVSRDLARRTAEAETAETEMQTTTTPPRNEETTEPAKPVSAPRPQLVQTAPVPERVTIPAPLMEDTPQPVGQKAFPSAPPAHERSEKVRILVAEDNDVNQIVFEQILEAIGVDYRIVANGEEAVAAWREMKPDLVLMDVSMPVMNGHQATRRIREKEKQGNATVHTPIIAVTAHAMAGDADACYAAGMDDYLTKPVSPEKLESCIAVWAENSRQSAATA
jgi:PAS domain S-box-containing protein